MIPANITRDHILKAIKEIDEQGVPPSREQTKYSLVLDGKLYPPKYTISIANKYANQEKLDPLSFSGGDETNPFLNKLDFTIIDISQWKEITHYLKEIYDARATNENLQNIINSKNEILSKYQPLFSPTHIPQLTAEEFSEFLDFKNNKHWSNLQRQKGTLTQDMERLKSALFTLVDESLPVRERLDRIRPKNEPSMVQGIGEATSTAILQIIGPDKYGVWNSTSRDGLKKSGFYPIIKKGATFGEQYTAINEVLIAVSREMNVDLWTLDALWFDYVGKDSIVSEENTPFLKKVILDAIAIADNIVKIGLADKTLSQSPDAKINQEKYNGTIKPLISEFSQRYGNTPNVILKGLLEEYAQKNHLLDEFEIQNFHFVGQKVNPYVWAAITQIDPSDRKSRITFFPQLYISINPDGIEFAFSYGRSSKK